MIASARVIHEPGSWHGDLSPHFRRETHGDFKHNFAAIASLWNGYFQARSGGLITAEDVAHMMVLLKIARTLRGAHNNDDYVDAIGYAMIAAGLAKPTEPNN